MATLLYQDIVLTLKNVYFCVAKPKVDLPDSKSYIILLGTNHLEELFGILRTMIGTDANVDTRQIGEQLSGVALISSILAKHPEWDRAPRRLRLPALTRDSRALPDNVDHIKPASWKGDVSVRNVTLFISWKRGRRSMIEEGFAWAVPIFQSLETKQNITILAPYGRLLVTLPPPLRLRLTITAVCEDRVEIEDTIVEADEDEDDDTFTTNADIPVPQSTAPAALNRLQDTELPNNKVKIIRHIVYQSSTMLKLRALVLYIRSIGKPGLSSTDRLKGVRAIGRYTENSDEATEEVLSSQNVLVIQDPVAASSQCDGHIFLSIGEVKGSKVNADSGYTSILHSDLAKQTCVTISAQLQGLRQSTTENDPAS